jgi:WD repeat-containing protein 68
MALPSSGSEYPTMQIYSACEIEHPYPCTKILWSPDGGKTGNYGGKDLLATTGDYLRVWSITEESEGTDGKMGHKREALLNNVSFAE